MAFESRKLQRIAEADAREALSSQLRNENLQKAKEHQEEANAHNKAAVAAILRRHAIIHRNKPHTLDLHYFHLEEAAKQLDQFLDTHITDARQKSNREFSHYLTVITGQGNNSRNRIPKIKPMVERRFSQRGLM